MAHQFPFIFVSGVSSEFTKIRTELKEFIKKYLDIDILVFEKEKIPGKEPTIDECEQWGRECDLFVLIVGLKYGNESPKGCSFTELEFNAAMQNNQKKVRVFVKDSGTRENKQDDFIDKVSQGVVARRYVSFQHDEELLELIPKTITHFLIDKISGVDGSADFPDIKVYHTHSSGGNRQDFQIGIINNDPRDIFVKNPFIFNGKEQKDKWYGVSPIKPGENKRSLKLKFDDCRIVPEEKQIDLTIMYDLEFELRLEVGGRAFLCRHRIFQDSTGLHNFVLKQGPV